MADGQLHSITNQLRRIIGRRGGCTLSDAQLLDDFVSRRDEASFEVLVWRHGAMVLSVCQRVLHDSHEAEDAFQATFLVFARKAGSIGKHEALGSWLYKVAFRVALRVRARTAKRSAREEAAGELPARETADEVLWNDLRPVLDEEIDRLPEKYRAPFVLCHLEGHTNEEAAELLGCPKGTILSRLSRGRERLRDRLTRRGLALSSGALLLALSQNAAAAVPAALVSSTVESAILFAAGKAAAGLVSASVAALIEGVLHTMFLTKLKFATAALLALAVLGTGVGVVSYRTFAGTPEPTQSANPTPRAEERQPEQETRADALSAEGEREERGDREGRRAVDFQGKVVEFDGKTLTLAAGGSRTEEPKKVTLTVTDKTKVEWSGGLKDLGYKLKAGDMVEVLFLDGSKAEAAIVWASRGPNVAGKTVAVAADGKSITIETPGPGRGEVTKVEIKLTDKTKVAMGRGEKEVKPLVGYVSSVWLVEGSKDTAGALQISRPRPDVGGTVTAVSADGKTITVESRGRGEPTKTEIKITDGAKVEFIGDGDKKIKVGHTISVWYKEGSTDSVASVLVNVQRRGPDVSGTIGAISADGKTITLEQRKRGEDGVTKVEIKLTDKTELEFAGTDKAEEKKLVVGYAASVWLQDGSKDTAAVIRATKPATRER